MKGETKIVKELKDKLVKLKQRIDELEKAEAEYRHTKDALQDSEEKYRTLVENVNIGVYRNTGGAHGRFLHANPAIAKMFGHDSIEEFMKVHISDLYQDPDDRKRFIDEIIKTGFVKDKELRLQKKDGTIIIASCTAKICYDERGNIKWIDGVIEDITKRKRAEERLKQALEEVSSLALTDDLTGLYNRRGFITLTQQALKMAGRIEENMLLLFTDLDKMKWINDTLGHYEGDLALIEAADILKETFRESDIIARIGGDEFAVLTIETSNSNVENIIRRLQKVIDKHNAQEKHSFKISISLGVAKYNPKSPCSINEMLSKADRLMYEHKHSKQMN